MRSRKELIKEYLKNGEKTKCISDEELAELGFRRPKRSKEERDAIKDKDKDKKLYLITKKDIVSIVYASNVFFVVNKRNYFKVRNYYL